MTVLSVFSVGAIIGATLSGAIAILFYHRPQSSNFVEQTKVRAHPIIIAVIASIFAWITIGVLLHIANVDLSEASDWGDSPVRNILLGTAGLFAIPIGAITLANAYNRTEILQTQSDQGNRRLEAELIAESVRLIAEEEAATQIGGILTLERVAKSNPDIRADVQLTLESFIRTNTEIQLQLISRLHGRKTSLEKLRNPSDAERSELAEVRTQLNLAKQATDPEAVQVAMRVLIRSFAPIESSMLDLSNLCLLGKYEFTNVGGSVAFDRSFIDSVIFKGRAVDIFAPGLLANSSIHVVDCEVRNLTLGGKMGTFYSHGSDFEQVSIGILHTHAFHWQFSQAKLWSVAQCTVEVHLGFGTADSSVGEQAIGLGSGAVVSVPVGTSDEDIIRLVTSLKGSDRYHSYFPVIAMGDEKLNWGEILERRSLSGS